ncbi:hypothetical protein H5410_029676 [Solanum commersonii]|uniref:Uncharacterized protein n=1 Tax=Solanum commersonii TaxID=4109 RepID=A0A9J5YDL2_SOLCO|nr:hypothetical protein H5410_029676 [Solanum commersonii]
MAKDQLSCTMCSSCDNPCQPISPPPPPSSSGYICPPPPPIYGGRGGGHGGGNYPPPNNNPYGYPTPPPPNPIVLYNVQISRKKGIRDGADEQEVVE